jgi:hypothetical protein
MGRLWDDHFRHLGHPPKFCRVQDASSGNNSPFWYHVRVKLIKNHATIIKCHVFSNKLLSKKKKGPCQDACKQSSGMGMHQNPHFQLKPVKNWKNPKIRIPSTIPIPEFKCQLMATKISPAAVYLTLSNSI